MNENNKKEKNDLLISDKIKNNKFNNYIISPKKLINKNVTTNKKELFIKQKRPNILYEEENNSKNKKIDYKSLDLKTNPNEAKLIKKNNMNNQNQI
jgi:hypothetical protein